MLSKIRRMFDHETGLLAVVLMFAGVTLFATTVVQSRKTDALRARLVQQEREWANQKQIIRADIETREGDRSYRTVSQHLRELGL
jgi:hypothetical protein